MGATLFRVRSSYHNVSDGGSSKSGYRWSARWAASAVVDVFLRSHTRPRNESSSLRELSGEGTVFGFRFKIKFSDKMRFTSSLWVNRKAFKMKSKEIYIVPYLNIQPFRILMESMLCVGFYELTQCAIQRLAIARRWTLCLLCFSSFAMRRVHFGCWLLCANVSCPITIMIRFPGHR